MGIISGCRYLYVNLKAKMYIYVYSTFQRCPNKIIKIFLIEDFFHLPPVSTTPVVNDTGGQPWAANISANFKKNLKRSKWDTLGLGGNWLMKKTRRKKSRDTVPLRRGRLFIRMISFSLQRQRSKENQHGVPKIVESRNQDKQHHHRSHWRSISLHLLSMETAALRQPYGVQNSTIHTSASNRSPVGDRVLALIEVF